MNGIEEYRANSTSFSSFLRKGNVKKGSRLNNEQVESYIVEIDTMFYKCNIDMIVYRGLDIFYQSFDKNVNELNVNDIITDKSYCSTTFNLEVAEQFCRDSYIVNIYIKKGSNILNMNGIGDSYHDYQNEVLLPRNSKFKVLSIKDKIIELELL